MKIHILAISDSDKHFDSAIQEYIKRLWKIVSIQQIKPVKNGTKEQIIQKETEKIRNKIQERKQKGDNIILLSKDGKLQTTQQFKKELYTGHDGKNHTFIIGWPYGLDESSLEKDINNKIAFGKITLLHGLSKLILLEQIYRSQCINIGKKYHY